MHWTSNIFEHSATTIGGFWVSLNYQILTSQKRYAQKTPGCATDNVNQMSQLTKCKNAINQSIYDRSIKNNF